MKRFLPCAAAAVVLLMTAGALARTSISLRKDWKLISLRPGEGIMVGAYRRDYTPKDAVTTDIPATVQSALFKAKKIPDPYFGKNSEKALWVEDKEWWYLKRFQVPPAFKEKGVRLVFHGMSYEAEIWLNGKRLGYNEGMMNPASFQVDDLLEYDGDNDLAVAIAPIIRSREGSIISQMVYWWDFGVRLVPMGLWRTVELAAGGDCRIEPPLVYTKHIAFPSSKGPASAALVSIKVNLSRSSKDANDSIQIVGSIIAPDGETDVCKFKKRVKFAGPAWGAHFQHDVVIAKPKLWEPMGYGEQFLYTLDVKALDEQGNAQDEASTRFGIRTVAFDRNRGLKDSDYPWIFRINGRKIYIKGANWVPIDFMFRLGRRRYEKLLDLARRAGIQLLRVWGGGIIESDHFYELCDRYGILVWQELPLANADYIKLNRRALYRAARSEITRVRNHPSLVLWAGGNELDPDIRGNKDVIDKLGEICAELDPDVQFRRASPHAGDEHDWQVWHGQKSITEYDHTTAFRSEAGLQAPPVYEDLIKFIPEKELWPKGPSWRHHNLQGVKMNRYANVYGAARDARDFIKKSQLAQAVSIRYNVDACRRRKYDNSGILVWQFNEPWPSVCWSMIDYYETPKPSYYFFKRAAKPVNAFLAYPRLEQTAGKPLDAGLYITNDSPRYLDALLIEVTILDQMMRMLFTYKIRLNAGPDSVARIPSFKWRLPSDMKPQVFFVRVSLTDANGKLLNSHLYWFVSKENRPLKKPVKGLWLTLQKAECVQLANRLKPFGVEATIIEPKAPGETLNTNDYAKFHADYQFIVLEEGDDICSRLSRAELEMIEKSVAEGVGFLTDGGWAGFANARIRSTPIERILPVSFGLAGKQAYKDASNTKGFRGPTVERVIPYHPILKGIDLTTLPPLRGYNIVKPKPKAKVLASCEGDIPLLIEGAYGKGRVLAWTSGLRGGWANAITPWGDFDTLATRIFAYLAGMPDGDVAGIAMGTGSEIALSNMPNTELSVMVNHPLPSVAKGSRPEMTTEDPPETKAEKLAFKIENKGDHIALFIEAQLKGRSEGVDCFFDDNYISLLPGEQRKISVDVIHYTKQVDFSSAKLVVTGWNSPTVEAQASGTDGK